MPQFSMFEEATGRIVMAMEVPSAEDAIANLTPGHLLIAGHYDGETHYIVGGDVPTLRPTIPAPIQDGHLLSWADPPEGLTARVYDLWIEPPHLLIDTLLSAPDAGLNLVAGGNDYRIDLTASFPWLPRSMEVTV